MSSVEQTPLRRWRVTGLLLLAFGCLPFLGGRLIGASGLDGALPELCPFRAVTGLPCPACGATRAFGLASAGDLRFLDYNGAWVLAALALAAAGLLALAAPPRVRALTPPRVGRLAVWAVALSFAAGWVWALANRATIVA